MRRKGSRNGSRKRAPQPGHERDEAVAALPALPAAAAAAALRTRAHTRAHTRTRILIHIDREDHAF